MAQRKRLGEILIENSLLTQDQLEEALRLQKGTEKLLGQILLEKGWVNEENLCRALSKRLHVQYVDVSKALISQEIIRLISNELAVKYHVLPVLVQNTTLCVAMEDPRNLDVIQQIEFKTGMHVTSLIAPSSQLRRAIRRHYNINEYVGNMLENVKEKERVKIQKALKKPEDARKSSDTGREDGERNEIVRLSSLILSEGIKARATDIHIEPSPQHVKVQYRIDGRLTRGIKLPQEVYVPLLTRLKVLSGMDITEHRTSQDGHIRITYDQRKVDLRISTMIMTAGEKLVIRILDKKTRFDDITRLGLSPEQLERYQNVVRQFQGLILVTGPTGSGKTTTLYALLNALRDDTKHIVTIEDPIEYQLKGITQIQINPKAGITFASGLRAVLRQDPNVILLGEIRDDETASVAIQASETGHLVLSTLHANDAVSTITRLLTLGISSDLIASSLLAVVAQRLIRKICPRCRKEYHPNTQDLQRIGLPANPPDFTFYKGEGCKACRNTGYYGQIGIFELFPLNDRLRREIANRTAKSEIRRLTIDAGMKTILQSGIEKLRQGITTLEEIARVCPIDHETLETAARIPEPGNVPVQPEISEATPESEILVLEEEISEKVPHIIVAEDDAAVRKIVQMLLQQKGYQVITAVDGEEALEKIHDAQPDMVILDINMPKRNGFSVCEAMRSSVKTSFIPVIMLTAQTSIESKLHGLAVGADDYMTKPFHPQELLARIDTILRQSSQEQKG